MASEAGIYVDIVPQKASNAATFDALHQKINMIKGGTHHNYYFGITDNPVRRFGEHGEDELARYKTMTLIYKSSLRSNVVIVEKELIAKYKDYVRCLNIADGGGGRVAVSDMYYVYMMHNCGITGPAFDG